MQAFSKREPLSTTLRSKDWQTVPREIKDRAIFSANVHSAHFLNIIHNSIASALGRWATAQTLTDFHEVRASFVRELSRVAIQEGMGPLGGQQPTEDISSATRLKLIFDTLTRQAYGFANYAYQLQRVNDWPAARFIRHPGARQKRPLHEQNENVVKPLADVQWWTYMNNRSLGGFEVPWPPYGFNSWMDREPVPRQEAISLGIIPPDYMTPRVEHPGFNDRIAVNVSQMSPGILHKLRKALGRAVTLSRGHLIFHPHMALKASQVVFATRYDQEPEPDQILRFSLV